MRTLPFVLILCAISCSRKTPAPEFEKIAADFVDTTLAFSPVSASGQGLHKYNGQDFDRDLDDLSGRSIQKQRDYYIDLHKRLEAFDKDALAPEDRADYDIIDTQIGLALFDIDIAQSWRHSPQSYVELLGAALFNPFVLEYAPKPERYEHIIARLQKVPGVHRNRATPAGAGASDLGARWRRKRTTAISIWSTRRCVRAYPPDQKTSLRRGRRARARCLARLQRLSGNGAAETRLREHAGLAAGGGTLCGQIQAGSRHGSHTG